MRQFNEIKLAIGIAQDTEISLAQFEELHLLAADTTQVFHQQSSVFWHQSAAKEETINQLLQAAIFEDFRLFWDYFVLVTSPEQLSLGTLKELVKKAEVEKLDVLVALNKNAAPSEAEPTHLLVRNDCLRTFTQKIPVENWLQSSEKSTPLHALLAQFSQMGYSQSNISMTPTAAVGHLQPKRLPENVHFFASADEAKETKQSLSQSTQVLGAALEAVAQIPQGGRIVLYGAGSIAKAVFPLVAKQVAFVVDQSEGLQGKDFFDKPIFSPADLPKRLDEFDMILISPFGREAQIRAGLGKILGKDFDNIQTFGLDGSRTPLEVQQKTANIEVTAEDQCTVTRLFQKSSQQVASPLKKTTDRTLTQRGVLYVGYPCNIKCIFCYYTYTTGAQWHSLEECMHDASLYRNKYGNNCVDITGGEPTVYPHIQKLVEHCSSIGLRPSIITNTLALAKMELLKSLRDGGAYDFLCSIHALEKTYDYITDRSGAWGKLTQAIENIGRIDMKWRTNCTITALNMRQLQKIAEFAYQNGSRGINFISYNPFYEWATKMDIDFQAKHSDIAPHLLEALDYCDKVGLEANVRYFPLCAMKGHEEKCYNFSQLSYDHHEWDFSSWYSAQTNNPSTKLSDTLTNLAPDKEQLHYYIAQRTRAYGYAANHQCTSCAMRLICDGFTNQYAQRFGFEEMQPYAGELISDPKVFIKGQQKVIDLD